MSIEKEAEEIWARWRRNEISHDEVQLELDKLLGSKPKGFFKKLGDNLRGLINQQFPDKTKETLHVSEYFKRRDEALKKLINETNWASYWQFNFSTLNAPSSDESNHIKQMDNHELLDFYLLIMKSLESLVNNDLENTEQAQFLHEYYLLIRKQIKSRGMYKLPKKDAFLKQIQHKKHYKEELEKMENARLTGSMCPYCDSENVRSYGKAEWKCHDCGKRFRKH